jgi:hypothetical protein
VKNQYFPVTMEEIIANFRLFPVLTDKFYGYSYSGQDARSKRVLFMLCLIYPQSIVIR